MTLLDWRLRRHLARHDLPDLPEVRRLMRLSWWNGFTGGALEHRVAVARREAFQAIARQGTGVTMNAAPEIWVQVLGCVIALRCPDCGATAWGLGYRRAQLAYARHRMEAHP